MSMILIFSEKNLSLGCGNDFNQTRADTCSFRLTCLFSCMSETNFTCGTQKFVSSSLIHYIVSKTSSFWIVFIKWGINDYRQRSLDFFGSSGSVINLLTNSDKETMEIKLCEQMFCRHQFDIWGFNSGTINIFCHWPHLCRVLMSVVPPQLCSYMLKSPYKFYYEFI